MKNSISSLLIVGVLALGTGCSESLFDLNYENDPVGNFEALWTEFNEMYGLFEVRGVDWNQVYDQYRPQVDEHSSDAELYDVLVGMLKILDDGHTGLLPVGTDLPTYFGGPASRIDTLQDFDWEILQSNYLPDFQEDGPMRYGFIEPGIGYLNILHFGDGERVFSRHTEAALDFLSEANGLIIDIRGEFGGEDIAGKTIASYFTDEERLYMTTRIKNGPGPDDFTEPEEWYLTPASDQPFTKPIILLTHRYTISARETFALAMLTLPQVTTVGDTTSGAFSNSLNRELPNGWAYTMSIGDWRAADGTSYEGRGIPPEIVVQNQRQDVLAGKDEALEKAIELLK